MDSIKDVVRSSVKVPEFDKHLKKAGGHIGRNVVEITNDEDNSPKNLNDKNPLLRFRVFYIAQSTGTVEYTDCTSTEG